MKNLRLLVPILYTAGLLLLSSIPADKPETAVEEFLVWLPPNIQNLLHIPVFAGLAYSWFWALSATKKFSPSLFLAVIFALAYAGIDEFYQTTVPGRFGSWTDLIFDAIGIGFCSLYLAIAYKEE